MSSDPRRNGALRRFLQTVRPDCEEAMNFNPRGIVILFALAWIGLLASAYFEPIDHGYIRYSAIAEAMVRSGDWIVPRHGGEIYVLKPPLFVWITALPIAAFGRVTEWASHLAPILGGAFSLAATYRLGARIQDDRKAGILAALILLSIPEFATEWRGERIDPLFGGLFALAMDALHESFQRSREGRATLGASLRAGIFLGLATLTKGPIAIAFLAVLLVTFVIVGRRTKCSTPAISWVPLALATIAVALPWPILFLTRMGWSEAWKSVGEADFATRDAPPWIYITSLPAALGAWILFVPALVGRIRRAISSIDRFTLCWFLGPFLALHVSSARHVRYLAPILPALAVLIAGVVWSAVGDEFVVRSTRFAGRCIAALATLGGSLGVVAVIVDRLGVRAWLDTGMRLTPFAIILASVFLVVASLKLSRRANRLQLECEPRAITRDTRKIAVSIAALTVVVFGAKDVLDAERFALHDARPAIIGALASVSTIDPLVCVGLEPHEIDMIACLARRDVRECESADLVEALMTPVGGVSIVARDRDWQRVEECTAIRIGETRRFSAWKDRGYVVSRIERVGD